MPTCHSTNAIGLEMIKNGEAENGLIVIASEQTAGKGQRGNEWLTERYRNLTFSILIDVSFLQPSEIFNLNMGVCLGILKTIQNQSSLNLNYFKVKWPNDIYYQNQKLGGILIETILKADKSFWAVVGIGLNVNQTEFGRLNATSLKNIDSVEIELSTLLEKIANNLELFLLPDFLIDFENLKKQYLTELYRYNQLFDFKAINGEIFEGKIIDIAPSGKIAIEAEGIIHYFDKQEVKFLK